MFLYLSDDVFYKLAFPFGANPIVFEYNTGRLGRSGVSQQLEAILVECCQHPTTVCWGTLVARNNRELEHDSFSSGDIEKHHGNL
jgi:hypothetical protein